MNKRALTELHPLHYKRASAGPVCGVQFDCPVCERWHRILVPWLGPSPFVDGRVWNLIDDRMESLTVTPSINCTMHGACDFHGNITNGQVTWIDPI